MNIFTTFSHWLKSNHCINHIKYRLYRALMWSIFNQGLYALVCPGMAVYLR